MIEHGTYADRRGGDDMALLKLSAPESPSLPTTDHRLITYDSANTTVTGFGDIRQLGPRSWLHAPYTTMQYLTRPMSPGLPAII